MDQTTNMNRFGYSGAIAEKLKQSRRAVLEQGTTSLAAVLLWK